MPRRIWSASRKPWVVSSPVLAVAPVSTALVVTVVPWTMRCTPARNASSGLPSAVAISSSPAMTATDGSSGVDRTLKMRPAPLPSLNRKSVNVPPTSMPIW